MVRTIGYGSDIHSFSGIGVIHTIFSFGINKSNQLWMLTTFKYHILLWNSRPSTLSMQLVILRLRTSGGSCSKSSMVLSHIPIRKNFVFWRGAMAFLCSLKATSLLRTQNFRACTQQDQRLLSWLQAAIMSSVITWILGCVMCTLNTYSLSFSENDNSQHQS